MLKFKKVSNDNSSMKIKSQKVQFAVEYQLSEPIKNRSS